MVEPNKRISEGRLAVGRTFAEVRDGQVPVRVCNLSQQDVTIEPNTNLATLFAVKEVCDVSGKQGMSQPRVHSSAVCNEATVENRNAFGLDVDVGGENLTQEEKNQSHDAVTGKPGYILQRFPRPWLYPDGGTANTPC